MTGLVNEEFRSVYGEAVFYYRNDIKTTREYYLYTSLSVIAEIGGYVGLLMGFSLLNLGQINNWLIDKWSNKNRVGEEEKNSAALRKVESAARKSKLEMPYYGFTS